MEFADARVGMTVKLKGKGGNTCYGIITDVFLNSGGGFTISLPDGEKTSLYQTGTNDIPIMDIKVVEYKGFCVGDSVKVVGDSAYSGKTGTILELVGSVVYGDLAKIKFHDSPNTPYITLINLAIQKGKISAKSINDSKFRSYAEDVIKEALNRAGVPWRIFSWELTTDGKLTITARFDDKARVGVAKCHPDDRFDVCIGAQVAVQRIKEQFISEKWKPKIGDIYWVSLLDGDGGGFDYSCYTGGRIDQIQLLLGNCFKTHAEAVKNAENVRKRYKAVEEFLGGYDNE
ncbi:hypothetical protein CJ260_00550 [Megasphaera sp. ASD88]|uniref:hypothetical protein n=1 Tax=Megasphaera sp. ASD88 TaxID=2027407 RepID=UPI000BAB3E8F|nr:hypothetical protein [Megasphaera sp. ASD88]PAV39961.1 hypothetical protein CJ260_00550 [Megasphaera sp. ASD88]